MLRRVLLAGLSLLSACTPSNAVAPPDVTITTTDASPCAIEQEIAQARLVRLPDGGTYLAPDCGK